MMVLTKFHAYRCGAQLIVRATTTLSCAKITWYWVKKLRRGKSWNYRPLSVLGPYLLASGYVIYG